MPSHIEMLDLSSNELMNVSSRWPLSLKWVSLSSNPLLREIPPLSLPNLKYLNLDGCQLSEVKVIGCPHLRSLSLRDTAIEFIDLDAFDAPLLREVRDTSKIKIRPPLFSRLMTIFSFFSCVVVSL